MTFKRNLNSLTFRNADNYGANAMNKRKWRTARGAEARRRCGAAAVEFALVAPIFIMMVFGLIEIGRAVMVQQVMMNAAREGARSGTLLGSTGADVTDTVNKYLADASLPAATVTFPQGLPEAAGYGDPVEVHVALKFSQVSWLPVPSYLNSKTLTTNVVMQRETSQ